MWFKLQPFVVKWFNSRCGACGFVVFARFPIVRAAAAREEPGTLGSVAEVMRNAERF